MRILKLGTLSALIVGLVAAGGGQNAPASEVMSTSANVVAQGTCNAATTCRAWVDSRPMGTITSDRWVPAGADRVTDHSRFTTNAALSGSTVSGAPDAPVTPASGWHVTFADGFGGPIRSRTGRMSSTVDNQWLFNGGDACKAGFNGDEVERFCPSQISEQSDGLHLTAAYTPRVTPCAFAGSGGCNYTSGELVTTLDTTPSTGFSWMPGGGETWAFQTVAKFAPQFDGGPTNGGNDEGWWASGGPPLGSWKNEFDYFEHWGYGNPPTLTGDAWAYSTSPFRSVDVHASLSQFCSCDPSASFHTYTTVINPDESFAWYMDGELIGEHAPPPSVPQRVWMKLILSYGLRVTGSNPNPVPGFKSGSRDFVVRSVSAYEDGAHAGQDVQNSAIAPGTTIGP